MARASLRLVKFCWYRTFWSPVSNRSSPLAQQHLIERRSAAPAIQVRPPAPPHVPSKNARADREYWRRKKSSSDRRGLLERVLCKGKDLMDLFSTDRRKPFQNSSIVEPGPGARTRRQPAGAAETPSPTELPGVSIDSTTPTPVHTSSLSLIRRLSNPRERYVAPPCRTPAGWQFVLADQDGYAL